MNFGKTASARLNMKIHFFEESSDESDFGDSMSDHENITFKVALVNVIHQIKDPNKIEG